MSLIDIDEFTLLYYYDASPNELVEFINNYSFEEIKYHIKLLKNLEDFNKFFKQYNQVDITKINNINKIRYIHAYKKFLIKNKLLTAN
jgi:hypothetical protein